MPTRTREFLTLPLNILAKMKHFDNLQRSILPLTYFFQLICSAFFALRLYDEWGTDYGIYYVGAISSQQPDFGLYSDFFDFKGPLYYGFLRILSTLISYNFCYYN